MSLTKMSLNCESSEQPGMSHVCILRTTGVFQHANELSCMKSWICTEPKLSKASLPCHWAKVTHWLHVSKWLWFEMQPLVSASAYISTYPCTIPYGPSPHECSCVSCLHVSVIIWHAYQCWSVCVLRLKRLRSLKRRSLRATAAAMRCFQSFRPLMKPLPFLVKVNLGSFTSAWTAHASGWSLWKLPRLMSWASW